MKMRRLVSLLLAVLLVMSCISVGIVASSAANADTAGTSANVDVAAAGSTYEDMLSKVSAEGYGLSETVNDGTILQAWTWSFANIEANLETIAEQGFTTIQVSPPNEIKKGTKGAKFLQSDGQNGWWMFYQPAGFQLNNSTDNALGTKAQFVSMCNKAHELGLKIIVDAVINHMGTKEGDDNNTSTDPMSHVTPKAATYESEIYNNKLFHTPWKQMQYIESDNTYYNSAYDLTRNCTSGLPDLKTEDQRVQNAIYDYMDELVAAGADGFRFDAAKHIETPDDHDGLGSDFWTDTLKKVQTKYSGQKEVYAYGEILNTCGISRPFSWYTKLMDVTDSKGYWQIKNAVVEGGSVGEWRNATPSYPNSNFTAANTMLWDESHDTYVDDSTTSLTTTQRGKIWALVAGRSGISSVYLARPSDSTSKGDLYSITLGEARKTAWSNATTKAINQFHNYYIGQSEYCTNNSGGTAYIERGSTGAMIVNLGGTTAKSVTLSNHKLTPGTYKDAISGTSFTVTGSQIKGSVGSTGVAVIYENNAAPTPTDPPAPTDPPETYILGDVDGNGTVDSADATIIMRSAIDMAALTEKQQLAGDVDGDGFVTVIDATLIQRYVAHMNVKYDIGKEFEVKPVQPTTPIVIPTVPTPDPTDPPTPEGRTIIFSNNKGFSSVNIYYWADGEEGPIEWPGTPMTYYDTNEYGEQRYSFDLPDGYNNYIINDGAQQTIDITFTGSTGVYCTDQDAEGHYDVGFYDISGSTPVPIDPDDPDQPTPSGSFLLTDNFNWGSAYVYAWDAEGNALNGQWPGASQAQTQTNEYGETQFVCYIPEGAVGVILNNGNGEQTEDITNFTYTGYWMDGSKNELGHYKVIGWNSDGTVTPDDPVTPTPYTSDSFLLTDNFGWGTANVYAWDANGNALCGEWPGASQAETITNDYGETQFRCYIPDGAVGVILNNGNGAQTEDITDFGTYDGYWMDGSRNEQGHYLVTGWNYSGDVPTDPDTPDVPYTPTPVVTDGNTIIFSNNKGFGSVNIYYWSDDQQPVDWPGVPMTSIGQNEFGEERFSFEMPDGMTNYIITDGNSQTVDIPFTGSTGVYMTDLDGEGHYNVDFYSITGGDNPPVVNPTEPDTPVDPTQPDTPVVVDGRTIIFSNNKGFSTVNIYYWADGEEGPAEWPGVPMTYLDTNEYGEQRYTFEMPAGMTNYIITDGVQQTVDIPFTGATGVYMLDSQDGEGHYEVGFYDIGGGDNPPVVNPTEPDTPVDPTQPDTPVVVDGRTIIFSNNKGFSTVNIYYWADGEEGPVEWPGVPMTYLDTNEYGEQRYTYELPEGMTNYIITDGVQQTVDVPFTGATGVYMLDTQDGEGHYEVGFYDIGGGDNPPVVNPTEPDTPVDPTQPPVVDPTQGGSGETYTLYFSNNKSWDSVNVYMWSDAGGESTEWPGVAATYVGDNGYGEGIYSVTVDTSVYDHVIFNGSGGQTADIDVAEAAAQGCGLYCLDTTDELGHFNVGFYEYSPVTPPVSDPTEPDNPPVVDPTEPDTPVEGERTIIFSNNKGFSSVNIYYWADGEEGPVEWPGVPMTSIGQNEYGEERFTFELPAGMSNYIITDGVQQTVDIPFTGSTGVYMLDDKDAEGHYLVGFYDISGQSTDPVNPTEPDDPNPPVGGNDITFEPGEASAADPAWFAWVWNDGSEGQWIQGTVSGSNIIFAGAADFGNILVVRMPTGSTSASFDTCWNQSEDVKVQSGTLYFTGWGGGNKFTIGWK